MTDFLSEYLGKPAWQVTAPAQLEPQVFSSGRAGFAFAKVGCSEVVTAASLTQLGFRLIDTNIQFDRTVAATWPTVELGQDYGIRFADPRDAAAVETVAATSFVYSRFHLDPLVCERTGKPNQTGLGRQFLSRATG